MAITTLAFIIVNIPLKWNKIVLIGTGLAFCAYVIRLFPIPFGSHTIILIIFLFLCLTELSGDLSSSLISSLISYSTLMVFEVVCISLLIPILGVTPEALLTDIFLRISITLPQVVFLFISAYFLKKYFRRGVNQ